MSTNVASHFDKQAHDYSAFRRRWPLGVLQRQEEHAWHQLADVRTGQWALDVGCGAGATLAWLRQRGAEVVGVDLSRRMAAACHGAGHSVCVQDMESLGFRPVFDWVLCIGSLEFVHDPAGALRNFAACLRPQGTLVLLFPRRGLLGILYKLYHRFHGVKIHLFSVQDITRFLVAAGLREPDAVRHCWLSSLCRARTAPDRTPQGPVDAQAAANLQSAGRKG